MQKHSDQQKQTTRAQNIAISLLRFYPEAWRERYREEVTAILEEQPPTWKTFLSLFLGLLDANWRTQFFTSREIKLEDGLRDNQISIFTAFLLFLATVALSTVGFLPNAGAIEDSPFWSFVDTYLFSHTVRQTYPILNLPYALMFASNVCFGLALLATFLGVLMLVGSVLRQNGRSKRLKRQVTTWLWSLGVFFSVGSLLYLLSLSHGALKMMGIGLLLLVLRGVPWTQWEHWILGPRFLKIILIIAASIAIWLVWTFAYMPLYLIQSTRKATFNQATLRFPAKMAWIVAVSMCGMALTRLCLVLYMVLVVPYFIPSDTGFSGYFHQELFNAYANWSAYIGVIWMSVLATYGCLVLFQSSRLTRQKVA